MSAVLRHDDGREERINARYLVGCDGAHSTVRTAAGIGFEGSSYPQTSVLADAEADGIGTDAAHAFLSERGMPQPGGFEVGDAAVGEVAPVGDLTGDVVGDAEVREVSATSRVTSVSGSSSRRVGRR